MSLTLTEPTFNNFQKMLPGADYCETEAIYYMGLLIYSALQTNKVSIDENLS